MATILNELGKVVIANDVIATLVGKSVEQCYGVVGMAAKNASDGIAQLLNLENYAKGIKVSDRNGKLVVDIYIIVEYGVSINAVAQIAIDTVKYNLEEYTGLEIEDVNIFVTDVHVD